MLISLHSMYKNAIHVPNVSCKESSSLGPLVYWYANLPAGKANANKSALSAGGGGIELELSYRVNATDG
jgi:hypothetical protein